MRARQADQRALTAAVVAWLAAAPVATALEPGRAPSQLRLHVWTQEDGLPQNTVNAITQTRDGYLWLGTEEGLVRFDGVRFVVHDRQTAPALRSPFVSALHEDAAGTLWIGTYGGGIARLRGGVIEAFLPEQLGSERIRDFLDAPGGVLLVATAGGGVLRIEGERVTRLAAAAGLPNDRVWALLDDGADGQWIATHGGGLARLRAGQIVERRSIRDGLPSDFIRALLRDPDGTLWIGTDGAGLVAWRDGAVQRVLTTRDGLPSDLVRSLRRDRDGSLWIGTDDGLARWNGHRAEALGVAHGLPSPYVRDLLEDREGNLWVGTAGGGLVRLRDTRLAGLTRREGLPADGIRALLQDREGRTWAGTDGGGLCRVEPRPVECWRRADGLPHDSVFALAESRDGGLWVGTDGGGVARFRSGRVVAVVDARQAGLPNDRVRALAEAADGSLWVGTTAGLARVQGGRASVVEGPGLFEWTVRSLLVRADGSLLVGTDGGGVLRIEADGSQARVIASAARGLGSNRVFNLAAGLAGEVWIGTSGGGLARLEKDGAEARAVNRAGGLHDDVVFQVVVDAVSGTLWTTSNRGLFKVSRERVLRALAGESRELGGLAFGVADGMPSAECNAAFPGAILARDGRLLVATVRGIAVVEPGARFGNPVPPLVQVEEAVVDGQLAPAGPLRVPAGSQRVELRYTGLSLRAPERVRFRHQLEGYDPDWVEAGTRRAALFTRLPPGDYTFRVTASNDDGIWSVGEARLAIRVEPRWHEMPLARAGALVLAVGVAFAALRLRLGAMQRRQHELEALVAERTRSLRAERERAEAASRAKSAFLANMSHELRTPLNAVLGFVQLMARRPDRDPGDREHLAVISRSGEHLLGLINDVLSLSRIEAGLATCVDAPFELGRLVRGLGELLQVRAVAKGLTVAVQVDATADVTVHGDEGKLRQILLNVLGNAIKFTERGRVVLRARWAQGRGLFEVEDSGPGIDPGEQQAAFEAFAQTASGRGSNEGAGLGLAISRSLARLQGGDVRLDSRPGQGTTVTVELTLPLATGGQPRERGPRGRVVGLAAGQAAPRVLVVDDSADNRRLLAELLRAVGCEVDQAADGVSALERWRAAGADLVFLDLRLPGLSGLEVMSELRQAQARGEGGPSRIVAVSASAFEHEREEALARGADAFLPKPYREATVFAQLEALLAVRFERDPSPSSARDHGGLDAARLRLLPAALREQLAAAAVGGEPERLAALAAEVTTHDAALGATLLALARGYRFDEIEAALSAAAAGAGA